jgi:hypothetical protein
VIIAIVTGIATIAGVVIAWLSLQGDREERAASPASATAAPITRSVVPYTVAPPVAEPTIRHRNRIELRPGETDTANLDAPQSSADWSFEDGSPPELRFTKDVRLFLDSGEIVTTGRRAATYSTCLAATGYERRSYEEAYLITGDEFCVRTSEGRIATFHFVGARPDLFTIDAIVYEPQHDF